MHPQTSSYHFQRRSLNPDITVNIIFSLLSAFLALIAIVQAAFLARQAYRRRVDLAAINTLMELPLQPIKWPTSAPNAVARPRSRSAC